MTYKRIVPILLLAIFSMACEKEELAETDNFGFANPDLIQGISLELTYPNGDTKTVKGDKVFGWSNGALLNTDYYKHISGGGDEITFAFRFSFPKTVSWIDDMNRQHNLRNSLLQLEQTGYLEATQAEFRLGSGREGEFDPYNNVSGTVNFKQDENNDNTYSIVAEIEGQVFNRKGEIVTISGGFWSRNLTNRN